MTTTITAAEVVSQMNGEADLDRFLSEFADALRERARLAGAFGADTQGANKTASMLKRWIGEEE